mmetsp:Transcript_117635/g.305264  ORF Transcript_117635/g.305264 Transcript_117635/m.305264 type:complete len:233 (+) Transcript_117635:334-1032(+)
MAGQTHELWHWEGRSGHRAIGRRLHDCPPGRPLPRHHGVPRRRPAAADWRPGRRADARHGALGGFCTPCSHEEARWEEVANRRSASDRWQHGRRGQDLKREGCAPHLHAAPHGAGGGGQAALPRCRRAPVARSAGVAAAAAGAAGAGGAYLAGRGVVGARLLRPVGPQAHRGQVRGPDGRLRGRSGDPEGGAEDEVRDWQDHAGDHMCWQRAQHREHRRSRGDDHQVVHRRC